jgi:thioredoxin 1/thioredoxin 2
MMSQTSLPKSFDELINQSEQPVLVDFWAEWCGACKMVSPTIRRIASEYKGRIFTIKVNVDQKPHISGKYQITSIPTIMMFYNGQILMRISGALPYEALKVEIEKNLAVSQQKDCKRQ